MLRFSLVGTLAVLLFDLFASYVSKFTAVDYRKFAIGSTVLYAVLGFVASDSYPREPIFPCAVATLVALVDASAGWYLSARVGPGRISKPVTLVLWCRVALYVVAKAVLIATAASFIAYALRTMVR
jgi:hypothetical protein